MRAGPLGPSTIGQLCHGRQRRAATGTSEPAHLFVAIQPIRGSETHAHPALASRRPALSCRHSLASPCDLSRDFLIWPKYCRWLAAAFGADDYCVLLRGGRQTSGPSAQTRKCHSERRRKQHCSRHNSPHVFSLSFIWLLLWNFFVSLLKPAKNPLPPTHAGRARNSRL